MKLSNTTSLGRSALASALFSSSAYAIVTIDYVLVDNVGNAADPITGYGAVSHAYNIGKYEVTNAQYAAFLNSKGASNDHEIFNPGMASYGITQTGSSGSFSYSVTIGFENKPVVYVSFLDAARFTNWINNGQGDSDTETGAYNIGGAFYGTEFSKNSSATIWIPSENEWYKAAYYDPTKDSTGGYWLQATRSDTLSGNTISVAYSANYHDGNNSTRVENGLDTISTDVGAFGLSSTSYYGTSDQTGNVWEWNESVYSSGIRVMRGGSSENGAVDQAATWRGYLAGNQETYSVGFRVATIPETHTVVMLMFLSGICLFRRRVSPD